MICPKCLHPLPNDSTFCQYCGQKLHFQKSIPAENVPLSPAKEEHPATAERPTVLPIPDTASPVVREDRSAKESPFAPSAVFEPEIQAAVPNDVQPQPSDDMKFCVRCGKKLDAKTKQCPRCISKAKKEAAKKSSSGFPLSLVYPLLAMLLIMSGYVVYQYTETQALQAEIAALEDQAETQTITIDNIKKQLVEHEDLETFCTDTLYILPTDGSYMCHTIDCPYISLSKLHRFNCYVIDKNLFFVEELDDFISRCSCCR